MAPTDTHNAPSGDSQFADLAPYYDELMDVVPYDGWADYVMLLFSIVGHEPQRVLDCACGTGNVTFELAQRGLEMTGVDLSAPMIERAIAKTRSAKAGSTQTRSAGTGSTATPLPARFLEADLTSFDLGEQFDSATCLYDSLNYILDPMALQAAFGRIAAHLEPGGVFVFDMNSVHALKSNLFTQRNFDPRKSLHYDWQASFDEANSICAVRMEFRRKAPDGTLQRFFETHRERAYPLNEVEAMLTETGWELLREFDAYTLNRPHARSERWFFVARKL